MSGRIIHLVRKVAAWAIVSGGVLSAIWLIAWGLHKAFGWLGVLAALGVPALVLLLRWAMDEIDDTH